MKAILLKQGLPSNVLTSLTDGYGNTIAVNLPEDKELLLNMLRKGFADFVAIPASDYIKMVERWEERVTKLTDSHVIEPTMIRIPAGSFEREGVTVNVPEFYMAETPVTQALWESVMGNNPSHTDYGIGPSHPVNMVSWNDAKTFITKLNELTGETYRLPSEAEWEYAAGGGTNNRTIWAGTNNEEELEHYAWYDKNSEGKTHPVKTKLPNALGLYDMSGNVYEWCEDDWYSNYGGAPTDGSAWVDSPRDDCRILRGGSWYGNAFFARSASRDYGNPSNGWGNYGLRLVLA